MITELKIDRFRKFNNISYKFGSRLNLITGLNGTGKSSILAMIGHSCELKKKDGVPIISNQFRTEFSEIFKLTEEYDYGKKFRYKTIFRIGDEEVYRNFSINMQGKNSSNKRIRPIPRGYKTSAKIKFPVLYLGLSRIYPIGEIKDEYITSKEIKLNDKENQWLIEQTNNIFGTSYDEIESLSGYNPNSFNKKGVGFNTNLYDFRSNSVGQDNLGQILLAILSFKRLKEKGTFEYKGGILLIDEIEASLFPHAQEALLELLDRYSKELSLQVIFTSHSTVVIEYMWNKYVLNRRNLTSQLYYNINFIDQANNVIIKHDNFDIDLINSKLSFTKKENKKLNFKIYTEDKIAAWFLKELIINSVEYFELDERILEMSNIIRALNLSNNIILSLTESDDYFTSRVLLILDGDTDITRYEEYNTVLKLPGDSYPEKEVIDYLLCDQALEYYSSKDCLEININKDVINKELEDTKVHFAIKENKKEPTEQDIYKRWLFNNLNVLSDTNLLYYWIQYKEEETKKFIKSLIIAHNSLAKIKNFEFIDYKKL